MLYFINCAAVDNEWMNEEFAAWNWICFITIRFILYGDDTQQQFTRIFIRKTHTHIDRNQNTQIICCYHRQICLANH